MSIEETLKILKDRNEQVTKPLRLPTEGEVAKAESDLSFKFPAQYRKFMFEASNVVYGLREPGLVLPDLMPYIPLYHIAESGWSLGVPRDHLPFCEDNGNYFTISYDGKVGYFDHDDGTYNVFESDFKDWIVEQWLEIDANS